MRAREVASQEQALRLSDRIALFNHGRIEQMGSGRDLYKAPRTRFVAGFIGNSNFIPASVTQRAGKLGRLTCPDGAVLSDIPIDALLSADHEALIMVRPDRMRLKPIAAAEGPQSGLRGTVTDATFLGDAMHFTVATGWGDDIIVRTPLDAGPAQPIGSGARVLIEWDAEQSLVFSSN